MLPQVSQNQIIAYRRYREESGLAEFSFHVVLGGETITAVGCETSIGCFPRRLGGKQFCHVRFSTAFLFAIEFCCRLVTHQIRGLDVGISFGDWKLNTLVRANGPAEDNAL